jgi:hypothetical protein
VKKIQSKHTQGSHKTPETFTVDSNGEEAPDEETGLKSTCQDRINVLMGPGEVSGIFLDLKVSGIRHPIMLGRWLLLLARINTHDSSLYCEHAVVGRAQRGQLPVKMSLHQVFRRKFALCDVGTGLLIEEDIRCY